MFKLALNAITGFPIFRCSWRPILALLRPGCRILVIPVVIIDRLMGAGAFLGQATTLVAVLFLGGVQLICLGILGEYIGRIYDEVKGRPLILCEKLRIKNSRQYAGCFNLDPC